MVDNYLLKTSYIYISCFEAKNMLYKGQSEKKHDHNRSLYFLTKETDNFYKNLERVRDLQLQTYIFANTVVNVLREKILE